MSLNTILISFVDVVPILTSAVIECHRAGLGSTAFNLASILMRPLHRPYLDPKYKRKIESVVRKPVRDPESPEAATPCPHCNHSVNESELTCSRCKNHIPFCLATVSIYPFFTTIHFTSTEPVSDRENTSSEKISLCALTASFQP